MDSKIIIGVPGPWATRADIVTSIAQRSGGFIFAGLILMDTTIKKGFTVEVYGHDAHLQEAFRVAGGGGISLSDLAAIGQHQHTLYSHGSGTSPEGAREMLRVGVGLLNAGGLGVKVESSGIAHSAIRWRELAASERLVDVYTAFVTLIGAKDCFCSCGMHVFGLPDAAVPRDLHTRTAAQLLHSFNNYLLGERPSLADGHTFSISADAPRFRLHKIPCDTYEPQHPFHNPHGMWKFATA
jgi:hypothetical protein